MKLPKTLEQSDRVGELIAIKVAADRVSNSERLILAVKSPQTICELTIQKLKNEEKNYLGIPNADLVRAAISSLLSLQRLRLKPALRCVAKRENNPQDRAADALADEGALQEEEGIVNPHIADGWKLTGAELNTLTQATAYKMIRMSKMKAYTTRRRTEISLQ